MRKSEMTDTWFVMPNGFVIQPICIDGVFLRYKDIKGETSIGHYINEERFEEKARAYPYSYDDWETLQDLLDKIEIEGGYEYFFCFYTGRTFQNTPLEEEIRDFRNAYQALEKKIKLLERNENDLNK